MRCGTFRDFERRFRPIEFNGDFMREHKDIPEGTDWHHVWTMIEGDRTRRWYLSPGYHVVNRLGYVVCEVPFTDAEQTRDYVYS